MMTLPVAIIGMGRSGSSLLSRLLNLSGLYLGPEDAMVEASRLNERGFWEHKTMLDLNERILAYYGGSWESVPLLPDGWHESPEMAPFRAEAHAFISTTFTSHEHWGWKVPHTTVLLPFWRSVVPDLCFIVCVRNPLDVCASVAQAYKPVGYAISFAKSLALWQFYTEMALRYTCPAERIIVSYEDCLEDYVQALTPVWQFLHLPPIQRDSPQGEAIRAFIEPGLQHHRHTLEDVLTHPHMPPYTKNFYAKLMLQRESLEAELSAEPCAVQLMRAQHCMLQAADQITQLEVEAKERVQAAVTQAARIAEQEARIEHLEAQLRQHTHTIDVQGARIGQLEFAPPPSVTARGLRQAALPIGSKRYTAYAQLRKAVRR